VVNNDKEYAYTEVTVKVQLLERDPFFDPRVKVVEGLNDRHMIEVRMWLHGDDI
jgi:hypothetical protein